MTRQYQRKASLFVVQGGNALDLSAFHFTFSTVQQDVESPNNAAIRIYNLTPSTMNQIQGEFSQVVLQAGYEGSYGVIFQGQIKQFRIGKENGTDTYLDLLCADGDEAYIKAVMSQTLAAGWNQQQVMEQSIRAMNAFGVQQGYTEKNLGLLGGTMPAPRGKVMFGMARAFLRHATENTLTTWNIQDGKVNIVARDGYLPGEAVVLTSATGLIGRVEQTLEGMQAKVLLNPLITVGGLVQLDNKSINMTVQQKDQMANLVYNRRAQLQFLAATNTDGFYRAFVVEHEGDTRGQNWYTKVVALALNPSTDKVNPQ